MGNSLTRAIIETVVRRTLKEIGDNPERSLRNLVDMAQQFAQTETQRHFFGAAQQLLKDESSAYYALVRNTVAQVDVERLLRFSMNLGYDGCLLGSKRISQFEKEHICNVPWTVSLELTPESYAQHRAAYSRLIAEGEELGIHCWMLFATQDAAAALELAAAHPSSDFCLFGTAEQWREELLDELQQLPNLMPVLRLDESAAAVCAQMRQQQLLYSLWQPYTEAAIPQIAGGELFFVAQQFNPAFMVLVADRGCPAAVQQQVHRLVQEARLRQQYCLMPWEFHGDNGQMDAIISEDYCSLYFDAGGQACGFDGSRRSEAGCLFERSLADICCLLNPKQTAGGAADE